MALHRSHVLFYHDWSYGELEPIKGGAPEFLRDSAALQWTGQRFVSRVANQPLFESVIVEGRATRGLLLDLASEPENTDPFALSAWTASGAPTESAANSVIQGQTARRLIATSAASYKERTSGVFSAGTETVTAIVEQALGSLSTQARVIVRNTTGPADVAVLNFNLSTSTVTAPTGTLREARLLPSLGPNGGLIWLARATYSSTAGQGRALRAYPDASGGNLGAVVHAAWIEENAHGSNPLVGTQARNHLTYPPLPPGVALAGLEEFIAGERTNMNTGVHRAILHVGDGHTVDPRLTIYQVNTGGDFLIVLYDDGTTERFADPVAVIAAGDHVRVTYRIHPPNGTVYAQVSVNGDPITSDASATGGIASAVFGGTTPRRRYGHASSAGANPCRFQPLRSFSVLSSGMDASTDHQEIFDELTRFRMGPGGEVLSR